MSILDAKQPYFTKKNKVYQRGREGDTPITLYIVGIASTGTETSREISGAIVSNPDRSGLEKAPAH
jgi:hypothetical protein